MKQGDKEKAKGKGKSGGKGKNKNDSAKGASKENAQTEGKKEEAVTTMSFNRTKSVIRSYAESKTLSQQTAVELYP